MTASERVVQLRGWVELARLTIGLSRRDAARLEQLESELRAALVEAEREASTYEAVDAHLAKVLGDSDR
jgi:hypothetical protein